MTFPLRSSEFLESDVTKSVAFQNWAGQNHTLVKADDINGFNFNAPGPFILEVFHGTTHEFHVFDAVEHGNDETQFGKVNYFTSSQFDAASNYLDSGPDLQNKIERLAEEIGDESEDNSLTFLELQDIARERIVGQHPEIHEFYVKTENPYVICTGSMSKPLIDITEFNELGFNEFKSDSDVEGMSDDEIWDEFPDEIWEYIHPYMDGKHAEITDTITRVANELDAYLSKSLVEDFDLWDITHKEFEQHLRNTLMLDECNMTFVSKVIQSLGYDSIVLIDADNRFSTMNMIPGTAHIHIFDENKSNIKSNGACRGFDPKNANIYA